MDIQDDIKVGVNSQLGASDRMPQTAVVSHLSVSIDKHNAILSPELCPAETTYLL